MVRVDTSQFHSLIFSPLYSSFECILYFIYILIRVTLINYFPKATNSRKDNLNLLNKISIKIIQINYFYELHHSKKSSFLPSINLGTLT
jgi:hypothetical protein